jgi:hypothetical protein
MKRINGFKRYKSLFDECLYKSLPELNGNTNYEIQIRQYDSTTHFSIYYTDGYNNCKPRFVQGWENVKKCIEEMESHHMGLLVRDLENEALIAWSEHWVMELDCCSDSRSHYEDMKEEFIDDYIGENDHE